MVLSLELQRLRIGAGQIQPLRASDASFFFSLCWPFLERLLHAPQSLPGVRDGKLTTARCMAAGLLSLSLGWVQLTRSLQE